MKMISSSNTLKKKVSSRYNFTAIQKILELGNQCLMNLGINEPIDDVQVFTCDQFYNQFFENAFPDFNFSNLEEA